MPLTDVEARVLGSLVEKEKTTPDAYPLSSAGLLAACNQKSNREPVMDLHLREVEEAVLRLRERGLAATVHGAGDRVPKHRHRLSEQLRVSHAEVSLLAVLLLRGPQTAAELRARTERYGVRGDATVVEEALAGLAARTAPLVANVGRTPGQSQDRWDERLTGSEDRLRPRARKPRDDQPPARAPAAEDADVVDARQEAAAPEVGPARGELEARLARLEARVAALEGRDGVDAPDD